MSTGSGMYSGSQVWALARHFGLHGTIIESDSDQRLSESTWVLLARSTRPLRVPGIAEAVQPETPRTIPLWRDDYSNLFRIVKW
jgi:hypothetical protein